MNEQPTRGPEFPKHMTLLEFRDSGYLQEINRRLLHPLGLALAIAVETDGNPTGAVKVWDAREDPEGFVFETWEAGDGARAEAIAAELDGRLATRQARLGFGIQPVG